MRFSSFVPIVIETAPDTEFGTNLMFWLTCIASIFILLEVSGFFKLSPILYGALGRVFGPVSRCLPRLTKRITPVTPT